MERPRLVKIASIVQQLSPLHSKATAWRIPTPAFPRGVVLMREIGIIRFGLPHYLRFNSQ